MIDIDFEEKWKLLLDRLTELYGEKPDVQNIIFMIGVQELGGKYRKFNKAQKLDVMHVSVCTLLIPYGYYEFDTHDEEGWPHFKATDKLPFLKPLQQNHLMRQAIVSYFEKGEFI
jgi:hypothetical protein